MLTPKRKFEKLKSRYLFAMVMVAIVVPVTVVVRYTGVTGRLIGFAGYTLFGAYCIYEFTSHLKLKKISVIYCCCLFFTLMFFEYIQTRDLVWTGDRRLLQLREIINIYSLGIPFIALAVLFLLEQNFYIIREFLYVLFIFFTIGIFARTMFFTNVLSYEIFLFLVLISVISDTAAYFGGFFFGKHKMAPTLSPKKTWEGAATGYAFTVLFVILYGYFAHVFAETRNEDVTLVFAVLVLPVFSQVGDLVFSMFKRSLDIKDFSNIIPGHGGFLDRIDSHTFVAVAFALIYGGATLTL